MDGLLPAVGGPGKYLKRSERHSVKAVWLSGRLERVDGDLVDELIAGLRAD